MYTKEEVLAKTDVIEYLLDKEMYQHECKDDIISNPEEFPADYMSYDEWCIDYDY